MRKPKATAPSKAQAKSSTKGAAPSAASMGRLRLLKSAKGQATTPPPVVTVPLSLPMVTQPSVEVGMNPDGVGARVTISFPSQLMPYIGDADLGGLRALGERMVSAMRALSRGPLSLKELAAMGHPYGRIGKQEDKSKGSAAYQAHRARQGRAHASANTVETITQAMNHPGPYGKGEHTPGRIVPRFANNKALGHIPGVRGSVPTLSVVNKQSGLLEQSYHSDVELQATGVALVIWNSAPESAFVTLGTVNLQAHGPMGYAPNQFKAQLTAEWARVQSVAWSRYQAEQQAQVAQVMGGIARLGMV